MTKGEANPWLLKVVETMTENDPEARRRRAEPRR